jgi:hypothetical protein
LVTEGNLAGRCSVSSIWRNGRFSCCSLVIWLSSSARRASSPANSSFFSASKRLISSRFLTATSKYRAAKTVVKARLQSGNLLS